MLADSNVKLLLVLWAFGLHGILATDSAYKCSKLYVEKPENVTVYSFSVRDLKAWDPKSAKLPLSFRVLPTALLDYDEDFQLKFSDCKVAGTLERKPYPVAKLLVRFSTPGCSFSEDIDIWLDYEDTQDACGRLRFLNYHNSDSLLAEVRKGGDIWARLLSFRDSDECRMTFTGTCEEQSLGSGDSIDPVLMPSSLGEKVKNVGTWFSSVASSVVAVPKKIPDQSDNAEWLAKAKAEEKAISSQAGNARLSETRSKLVQPSSVKPPVGPSKDNANLPIKAVDSKKTASQESRSQPEAAKTSLFSSLGSSLKSLVETVVASRSKEDKDVQ